MRTRHLSTLLAIVLLSAAPAWAQSDFGTFESITVANTAIGLTNTTYSPTAVAPMTTCSARLEVAEVRYRMDGTNPTTSAGTLMEPGDELPLASPGDMVNVRFIRTGSVSGVLNVSCWRVSRPVAFARGFISAVSDHPNRIKCIVTVSTATTIQAVGGSCAAPGAGLSIYVTDISFGTSAAAGTAADSFPTLKSGTGGACGTATAVFWQALTTANSTVPDHFQTPIKLPTISEICWIMTTAGSKTLQINGFIAP